MTLMTFLLLSRPDDSSFRVSSCMWNHALNTLQSRTQQDSDELFSGRDLMRRGDLNNSLSNVSCFFGPRRRWKKPLNLKNLSISLSVRCFSRVLALFQF